ncbi:MAG TPA: DUF4349 domain-containing protein [Acholeplasma sp.]|nr:DUF4349 domain-containing protein [Acholeplasma sp.]
MKKRILLFFVLLMSLFLLTACSADSNFGADNSQGEGSGEGSSIVVDNTNRKIIYTANLSIKSPDLIKTTNEIKDLLLEDEWIESEDLTSNSNYITFRIKTSRLNSFIDSIRTNNETTNFRLESKDVSINYLDVSSRIEAFELEKARLMELYENASMYEMIQINERISQIDSQLISLNRTILEYDSLVDYSVVKLWIYGPTANPNPPSYGTKLSRTFKMGWNGVVTVLQTSLQVVVFLIPFLIIIVPVGGIVWGISIYRKRKKDDNNK